MEVKDPKYLEICEICHNKKEKVLDELVCIECHRKYMRHQSDWDKKEHSKDEGM